MKKNYYQFCKITKKGVFWGSFKRHKSQSKKYSARCICFEDVNFIDYKSRFPRTLQRFRYIDSKINSKPRYKVSDWIDIFGCNQVRGFELY